MKPSVRIRLAISIAAIALVGAACGSDDSSDDTAAPAATEAVSTAPTATTVEAPTTTAAGGGEYGEPATTAIPGSAAAEGVSIELGDTSLGKVLTSDGLTLYMFVPDEGGTPTCVDACAGAWPPLLGSAGVAGSGVDADDITVVDRPDGTKQLAYYGWPLYFYAEDQAAGDVTGQGVGGKWYVLGADGNPIES
jgi:predicted lipoprotein with Yx(FWY)xxD motif